MSDAATLDIKGDIAPGFEGVRDAFANNFASAGDVGASFAIWKDGKYLVDIWGGHADAAKTKEWQRDTLPNVWSTTKAVAAFALAILVERGQLSYDDKITKYWPEFGAHGKDQLTVGQVLSHQSGVSTVREPLTTEDLYDHDAMAARMAAAEPLWEPGTRSGYHALTFAFPTGELVKRITGKTIGQFFREEVAGPWDIDFHIGLPESEEPRIAEMIEAKNAQSLDEAGLNDVQKLTFANPAPSALAPNTRAWRAAELSSAGGRGSASALAKLYGAVATDGTLNGKKLISAETREKLSKEQIFNEDLVLGLPGSWGAGVLRNLGGLLYGPNEATIGHSGWGGSFVLGDPTAGVGIAYVMNQMGPDLAGDPRAMGLLAASYEALSA
jgi:CubicO group peptidase (beta-lactamase class C family)